MQRLEQLEEEHGHPARTAAPSSAPGRGYRGVQARGRAAEGSSGATAVDPVAESQRAS